MDFREKLHQSNFDSESVVSSIIKGGGGQVQLEHTQRRLNDLREQASLELRKNAFKYHNVILSAAKEMQQLEKNLQDLKGTLAEEKSMLTEVINQPEVPSSKKGEKRSSPRSLDNVITRYRANDEKDRREDDQVPRWYCEASTEIEDLYEMRQFSHSVELLLRAKSYYQSIAGDPVKVQIADVHYQMILEVERGLVERLLQEMTAVMDCPFGVNDVTSRSVVDFLKLLNKSYEAAVKFLSNRTDYIQLALSSLKQDGSIPLFVKRYAETLFSRLVETVKEFDQLELSGSNCRSALNGWIRFHLKAALKERDETLYGAHLPLSVVADSVGNFRTASLPMASVGADVSVLLISLMDTDCIRVIDAHVEGFCEKFQSRFVPDSRIQPILFASKESLAKRLMEIASSPVGMVTLFVDGSHLIIDPLYLDFAEDFLSLMQNISRICTTSMRLHFDTWLKKAIDPCLRSLQEAVNRLRDPKVNMAAVGGTIDFFLRNIVANVEQLMRDRFGGKTSPSLLQVKDSLYMLQSTMKTQRKNLTFL